MFVWTTSFSSNYVARKKAHLSLALLCMLLAFSAPLGAQTTIFSSGGRTYSDTDGPTGPDVYSVDISNCTSVSISLDYSFSVPWDGPGNMESADECPFGMPPCLGDPTNPLQAACAGCWDFLWVRYFIGGSEVVNALVGGPGTTDADQTGTIGSGGICTSGASNAEIRVVTQTWAGNESVTFTNIVVMCYEGQPIASTNDPVCSTGALSLIGSAQDPSVVSTWSWSNSGTGIIADPSAQNTTATNPQNGETYTLTTTDLNGCPASTSVTVVVNDAPAISDPGLIQGCDNVILPPITGSNLSNPRYFTGPGGTGTAYDPGDVLSPPVSSLFIYDDAGGGCIAEISVSLNVVARPVISDPGLIEGCDNVVLPIIAGSNLVNPRYYTGPGGTGTAFDAGDVLTPPVPALFLYDQSAPGCFTEISVATNVVSRPIIDDPGLIEGCENAFLPPITGTNLVNPRYYTGPAGTGTAFDPGDAVSPPTTSLFIYDAAAPACFGEIAVTISIVPRPLIDDPGVIEGCGDITLPLITGTNLSNPLYYTGAGGTGTVFNPGDMVSPPITSLFIYDNVGGGCVAELPVSISVASPPSLDDPGPLEGCDNVSLPLITGTGLVNPRYYTEPNGGGTTLDPGDLVSLPTNLLYIFDDAGSGCTAELPISVIITPAPVLDNQLPLEGCDSVVLPIITGVNLTGNQAYYDMPGGQGNVYLPGAVFFSSISLFVYDGNTDCSDEQPLDIRVFEQPEFDVSLPDNSCEEVILPIITGTNLSGNQGYFDQPNGGGMQLMPGDTVSSDTTIFLIDNNGGVCFNEDTLSITFLTPPSIDNPGDLADCDSIALPVISGTNLSGGVAYFDAPNGQGNQLAEGSFISSRDTIYIYDSTGNCVDEVRFIIDISPEPSIDNPGDLIACDSIELPAISGANLSVDAAYFDQPSGAGNRYSPGDYIRGSGTYYIFDGNGNCSDEVDFEITLNTTPQAGMDNGTTVCAGVSVDLTTILVGADLGGRFLNEDGAAGFSGTVLNTSGLAAGSYRFTYIVDGIPPCENDSSLISINVGANVNAGLDASGDACIGDVVNLFALLNGADLGGSFNDDDGTGALVNGSLTTSSLAAGSYQFTYTVGDGQVCPTDEATITVELTAVPSIDNPGDLTGCDSIQLPVITGSNLSANAAYYDQPDGMGTSFAANSFVYNSTILYIYDSNGNCEAEESLQLTVTPSVSAGVDNQVTVCQGASIDLLTALPGADVGGSFSDDDATGALTGSLFNTAGIATGDYRFTYRVSGTGPCPDASAVVTISVGANVNAGLDASGNACIGDVVNLFALLNGADLGGSFNDDDGTGALVNGNLTTSSLAAGSYQFTYTVGDGQVCPTDEATITVELTAVPSIVNPGDLTGCDSIQLPVINGSNLSANAAYYDQPDGMGASFAPNSFVYNSTILYIYDSNGNCEAEESLQLTVTPSVNAGMDNQVTVCQGASIDLLTALPGADVGGSFSDDDATGALTGSLFNTAGIATGDYRFTYRVSGTGPCPDASAVVTISVGANVNAGLDASGDACIGDVVNLFALLNGADLGGNFNDDDGTGALVNGSLTTSSLAAGSYQFTYTVGDGQVCPTDEATITVELTAVPSIDNPGDLTGCDSIQLPVINGSNLSANAAYYDQPDGMGTSFAPNSFVYNSTILYIYDSNGNCEAEESLQLTVTPSVNAGVDNQVTVCQGASIDLLTALPGADVGGSFSDDDATGALTGSLFNTAGIATGDYRFTYSISGTGPCPDASAVVTISVSANVSAGLDSSGDACIGDVVNLFALLNGADLGGSFNDDDGTGALVNGSLTTSFLAAGSYQFTYTVGDGQVCPTDEATIMVELTAVPSIVNPGDLTGCDSIQLPAITGSNLSANAAYYDQPDGMGTSFAPNSFVYNSTILYIYDSNGNCEAEESLQLTVTPSVSAGVDNQVTVCQGASIDLLTALPGADVGGSFSDDDATGALTGSLFNTAGIATGDYRFTYRVSGTGPCPDASAVVTISVGANVNAGLDASGDVCIGDVVNLFALLNGADLGGSFNDDDGTGALVNGSLTTSSLAAGSYQFTYTVGDGQVCPTDEATITVELTAVPSIVNPGDLTGCDSIQLPAINGSNLSANAAYYDQPDGMGTSFAPNSFVYNSTILYIYDSNGNCEAEESLQLTVTPSVSAGVDNQVTVCQGASIDLLTALPGADVGGSFSDDDATGALTGSLFNTAGIATGDYRFTYSISGTGPCPDASAVVLVNVSASVSAGQDVSSDACIGEVVDLFSLLSGADTGGSFSDDDGTGAVTNGMLTTTTLAAGDYRFTYTVGDGQVCPEDNAVVTIRLQAPPVLVDPGDLSACDSLELPIIVGSNLSADAAYFDQPNGQGTRFSAGSFIYNDVMLFLFDQNGDCSSEESINIQIGRSASAGDDNAVSICSGANVDLVTVLENADPGGTFSELDGTMRLNGTIVNTTGLSIGAYRFLYRVSGTAPCPDDEAILTINIQNAVDAGADNGVAICPGQSVDLETVLVGADPGGVFSDNNSTGGLTGSIFDASGLAAGIYTFTYTVGNGQNCSSDEAIISVQVNDPPQFVDPGDIAVCDFYVLPAIQGTNFNSAGYFDQPGGNGNVYAVGDTIRDFTVLYIYGQNGNCEGEAQFEVSFLEVPTINGLAVVCDLATGTYRVSFNINGGDIGTYTVTGNAGLLTNITFLSDPIAIGSPYLFNVQDGNNCGTVTVSDVPDCDCISDAGILAPASQRVCESSLATFIHSGPNLDGDDQLFFVLHDGSTAAIGNILAVSATPSFGFQTGMLYGQPYFVTAVVANSTSSGGIDFNDPCLSASEGVAVVFDPEISGRIEGDTTLCEGQDALIQFVLEGGSTFDAVLVSALGADTLRSIPNGHTLTVPGIAAVYTLVSLEVAGSACIAQLPSSSVEIVVNRLDVGLQVLSDYNGFAVSCPDAADGVLEATINGSGSSFNLQWNNGGSTAELNNLAEGNYVVTVTDDLGCSNVSNITLDAPPALDIFLQAQSPLCFGEAEGAIIIDSIQGGSGSYEYSLDGEQFTALTNYPFAIPFLAAGQYEVTILDANDCASVRNTVILEPPLAVVEIGDVRLVKFGERPQLNANLNFDPQTIQWLAEGDILIDCDTCLNTVVEPRTGGRLILLLTDENGCPASDTLNIVLDKTRDVFIPNVFSPNNDGFNDRFTVLANDSQVERVIQLRIYDRWGEVVYEAFNFPPNDNTFGWDGSLRGELLDPAVFVYFAEVEFVDGFREVFQGDLTLVR